jgi:hypothetical protein
MGAIVSSDTILTAVHTKTQQMNITVIRRRNFIAAPPLMSGSSLTETDEVVRQAF